MAKKNQIEKFPFISFFDRFQLFLYYPSKKLVFHFLCYVGGVFHESLQR
jgi:hypothetical protein